MIFKLEELTTVLYLFLSMVSPRGWSIFKLEELTTVLYLFLSMVSPRGWSIFDTKAHMLSCRHWGSFTQQHSMLSVGSELTIGDLKEGLLISRGVPAVPHPSLQFYGHHSQPVNRNHLLLPLHIETVLWLD